MHIHLYRVTWIIVICFMNPQGPMGYPAHMDTPQKPIGPQPTISADDDEDSGYMRLMGHRD